VKTSKKAAETFAVDKDTLEFLVRRLVSVEAALERAGRHMRLTDARPGPYASADAITPGGAAFESVAVRYAAAAPPQIAAALGVLPVEETVSDDPGDWTLPNHAGVVSPIRRCDTRELIERRDQAIEDICRQDKGPRAQNCALVRAVNRALAERGGT
jgi:hypothetical protein